MTCFVLKQPHRQRGAGQHHGQGRGTVCPPGCGFLWRRSRPSATIDVVCSFFPPVNMDSSANPNKPVKAFRLRGISASVFANQAKTDSGVRTFHKVSIQRTYKDGDEFKTTTSFGRDDLPVVCLLMQQAWEYILETEAKSGKNSDE